MLGTCMYPISEGASWVLLGAKNTFKHFFGRLGFGRLGFGRLGFGRLGFGRLGRHQSKTPKPSLSDIGLIQVLRMLSANWDICIFTKEDR